MPSIASLKTLASYLAASEEWLLERVLAAARDGGYAQFTATSEVAWRESVAGITRSLAMALEGPARLPALHANVPYDAPHWSFALIEAQRHRSRGVSLQLFLGLLKHFRNAYNERIATTGLSPANLAKARETVGRFFDHLELAVLTDWTKASDNRQLSALQDTNRQLSRDKNQCLTILENIPSPLFLLDGRRIVNLNRAATALLGILPGRRRSEGAAGRRRTFPLLQDELTDFASSGATEVRFSRSIATRGGSRHYLVTLRQLADVTGITSETVVLFSDLTDLKRTERELQRLFTELEDRVKQRTGELTAANEALQKQILERQRAEEQVQRLNAELEQRVSQRTDELLRVSDANSQKLKELTLLYRISNTMLSTIRLDKLSHLILAALTSGPTPFFDRAMLFLVNDRAEVMQGMLGVTIKCLPSRHASLPNDDELLAGRWDISAEEMAQQQDTSFSRLVKTQRLALDRTHNVISRAALDRALVYVPDAERERRLDRSFVRELGLTSFAAVPLFAKDTVIGAIVVDNAIQSRPITNEDLRFLQLFTNQAGMAIENSLLYKQLEEANRTLRETQERLIHGERLATIGEMSASIAHELKGPLVAIGGFARRLQRKLSAGSAEAGHAATISSEVTRLEKLLTTTLSFSRKTTICYTTCAMHEVIEEALAIITPSIQERGIIVGKRFPAKVHCILGDCQQLKQVFINLFFNAVEAMPRGGHLDINVSPARLGGKEALSVKVADTGGGIPQELVNKIFSPFFTTKETGTGLGLSIANRIVTNHGGKIQVRNREGKGVEFNVLLPANC